MYDWVYIYEFEGNLSSHLPSVSVDPDYIGCWREADYSFLFFQKEKKAFLQRLSLPFRSELVIRHEDWESGISLDILHLGRITIHPPWKVPRQNEGIQICIDPNMAFGSGYHPTTKGCLILIDKLFRDFIPRTVLDLGTGTGILSIACLKLGAEAAFSIDCNNLSTDTAKKNRSLNGMEKRMHLWRGDAKDFLYIGADLLIANLHFAVIGRMTEQEEFYSPKYYILSGLMGHEGPLLEEKLKGRLNLLDTYQENLWFSYLLESP